MRKSRGFSLIELMVVVAILAFLAGLLIPRFLKEQKARQDEVSKTLSK